MKFTLLVFLLFFLSGCEQVSLRGTTVGTPNHTAIPSKPSFSIGKKTDSFGKKEERLEELIYLEDLARIEKSPQPILVYMHGYGDNERGPLAFSKSLNDYFFVVSIRAPIELGSDRYAWFGPRGSAKEERVIKHAKLVIGTIENLPRTPFDQGSGKDRTQRAPLYVAGFSQGARMAIEVAKLAKPGLVQGVLAFSPATFKAEKVDIPLWISHGTRDPIVAFQPIQSAARDLKAKGSPVHFEVFDGQHEIPLKIQRKARRWISAGLIN